jgi:hypothetical protein
MPTKTVLFSGRINIYYRQFYVEPDDGDYVSMDQALSGQSNGICGASQTGRLFLTTGTHSGDVYVDVEYWETPPPLDESWEDIVECSFKHGSSTLRLFEWGHEKSYPLALPGGEYRVRYCARDMDQDFPPEGHPDQLQSYLLQFWIAPSSSDRVLKASSESGKYWHREVSKRWGAA